MVRGSKANRVRVSTELMAIVALLAIGPMGSLAAQETKTAPRYAVAAKNSPAEPLAPAASMTRAAAFLDGVAVNWTRQHKCGTCHTNYPYLVARPVLKESNAPALAEVRRFFEERVAHWDDNAKAAKPKWDAEVIATAAALALNDAATTGALHNLSCKALDRMWTLQKPDGGFNWLKCGWPPFEHDDYYGAIVAALGAGGAPGAYAQTHAARAGLAKLRDYFSQNPPPDLHHQTVLLWASTRLDGLMTAEKRSETIARLRHLQRADGGWNLPSLGSWKRRDDSPNLADAPSDGYATGLIVFVLRQAGVPASDPALERGVGWLRSHQRASGRWFTRSLNNDEEHYITNAGTAYAVLALHACGADGERTAQRSPRPSQDMPPALNTAKTESAPVSDRRR